MKTLYSTGTIVQIAFLFVVFFNNRASAQNATISNPISIGKSCDGTGADSLKIFNFNSTTSQLTKNFDCKPNIGGKGDPTFSSTASSITFNPQDQKLYYIKTTTGGDSYVYSWAPSTCPTPPKGSTIAPNYSYASQMVVGLDFDPITGDGFQLLFNGSTAPYVLTMRKVNFANNYFGPLDTLVLPAGKTIYQQSGDIVLTPSGQLYFAFDNKLFQVDYSNYGPSAKLKTTYIDTLAVGSPVVGLSYAQGKFIASSQTTTTPKVCNYNIIDISGGTTVIKSATQPENSFYSLDMASMITGIGVAKKVSSVTPGPSNQWTVQYDIRVKNFGNTTLNNVQVTDDLSKVFGTYLSSATVAAVGSLPSGVILNTSFNGKTNINLFAGGTSSILKASPPDSLTVRVTVTLNNPPTNTAFYSTSIASGSNSVSSIAVSDSSNDSPALMADINNNSVPDDANEDVPTPLILSTWTVLPNIIVDFNASYSNNAVTVKWLLQDQQEGTKANIQRSTDGITFDQVSAIPLVASTGTYAYKWVDKNFSEINYYRLELVDKSGKRFYSTVVKVMVEKPKVIELTASPNPFSDHVSFSIGSASNEKIAYKLINLSGFVIAQGERQAQIGENKMTIQGLGKMPAGTYLLQVVSEGKEYHKTVIKVN